MAIEAAVNNIPVIDLSPFIDGDRQDKQAVARTIYRACHEVGFMYLKNHGISQEASALAFEQSRKFFALPLEKKQAVVWSSEISNRGYVGIERERLDETKPGDLKEAFNVGSEVPFNGVNIAQQSLVMNLWPTEPEEFKAVISDFFKVCAEAAEQIFRAFAIALQMPETYIAQRHQTQDYTLRLLHYPPLNVNVLPKLGQIRAGAHSDYGTLTLLFQDDVGGLEVQLSSGEWMAAPSIPDAILINTGDLTQRWSNDVFRSTKHRVRLPQPDQARRDRYSIAFFCQPDADADISCFPSCQGRDNPPRYAPVKAGDYLLSRLRATY